MLRKGKIAEMASFMKVAGSTAAVLGAAALIFYCVPNRDMKIADLIDTVSYREIGFTEPSKDKLMKDFDQFTDVLLTGIPNIEDGRKVFGYSFADKMDDYRRMAEDCENAFDFYCLLEGICADVPNCHTYMNYAQGNYYFSTLCFNSEHALASPNVRGRADAWYDYLGEKMKDCYENSDMLIYLYADGHYMNIEYMDMDLRNEYGAEILEIDGEPVADFVEKNMFYSKLRYDFKNDMAFRDNFSLNVSGIGEEHTALMAMDDGTECEKTVWYSLAQDIAGNEAYFYCSDLKDYDFESDMQEADDDSFEYEYIDESDTLYINLLSFNYFSGTKLYDLMAEYADSTNIILDVRDNGGGITGFWEENIYEPLFYDELNIENVSYLELNHYNKNPFGDLWESCYYSHRRINANELPFSTDSTYPWYKFMESASYTGEYSGDKENDRNIYILAGRNSASLADEFVHYFKTNDLAVVIGENPMGEGIAPTYMCSLLPETGLLFNYSPFVAFNSDGNDNSIYGTEPDIYVTLTPDDYLINRKIRMDGGDTLIYENRLKWDTELKYVLALAEENASKEAA